MGKKGKKHSVLSAMLAHPLVRDVISDLIAAAVVAALSAIRDNKRMRRGAKRVALNIRHPGLEPGSRFLQD